MSKSQDFYMNEIGYWRGIGAIGVSTLLIPATVISISALLNFNPFSPYLWLTGIFWALLTFRNWCYIGVMCAVFVVLATSTSRFFAVVGDGDGTRLARILCVLRPRRFGHVMCQGVACGAILWALLGVLGGRYASLFRLTDNGERELHDQHVFLLSHAFYVGCVSAVCFFTHHRYIMQYPPIQQSIWNASRDHILHTVKESALFVLNKVFYFYLLYYVFFGGLVRGWLARIFRAQLSDAVRVDSVWGMLDVHLLLWTCITGTVLLFFINMFMFIYTLYQTEPYEMVVQCGVETDEHQCMLRDGLAADTVPLLQFQAYQDLYLLSKQSAHRRAQLFSLSPLGGHPHVWSDVSKTCLSSLSTFTEQVQRYNTATLGNGTGKPAAPPATAAPDGKPAPKPTLKEQIVKSLQQTQAMSYLLSTPPEAAIRQLLAHAQKHAWNVQALCNVVVSSYSEDKYGVVQKSLPDVISAVVTLRDEMEKLCKLTGSARNGNDVDTDPHALLRSSLKQALYSITNTFAPHLDSIQLSPDIKKRLRLFVEYKV